MPAADPTFQAPAETEASSELASGGSVNSRSHTASSPSDFDVAAFHRLDLLADAEEPAFSSLASRSPPH